MGLKPIGDRIIVRGRPAGQLDGRPGGDKPGEPLGEMSHDVASGPAGDRGRGVPERGTADPVGEQLADLPVPLGGAIRQRHRQASGRASRNPH